MEGFPKNAAETNPANPEREISPEMRKLKSELEQTADACDATLHNLRNRSDEGLADFVEEGDIARLSAAVAGFKELDLYSGTDFRRTEELITQVAQVVEAIELRARDNVMDDADSLKSLAWAVKTISETAYEVEAAARNVDGERSVQVAELARRLADAAINRAGYIAERSDALERYSS